MMGEKKTAKTVIEPIDVVESALEEIELLGQLAEEEGEELVLEDAERAIRIVEKGIEALDFRVMLGSPQDKCNAFVAISAGAGGVDACDWAAILMRMYVRWGRHMVSRWSRSSVPTSRRPVSGRR